MDVMKEDMAEVEVTEEDTEDRNNWRRKSAVATPDGKTERRGRSVFIGLQHTHSRLCQNMPISQFLPVYSFQPPFPSILVVWYVRVYYVAAHNIPQVHFHQKCSDFVLVANVLKIFLSDFRTCSFQPLFPLLFFNSYPKNCLFRYNFFVVVVHTHEFSNIFLSPQC